MGTTPTNYNNHSDFNSASFVQPGITEKEVIELKTIFNSLDPINGYVEVSKIKALYRNSCKKDAMDSLFHGFSSINFNEFYNIMSQEMISTRNKYQDVEFDGEEPDMNFFYCSFTRERKTKI